MSHSNKAELFCRYFLSVQSQRGNTVSAPSPIQALSHIGRTCRWPGSARMESASNSCETKTSSFRLGVWMHLIATRSPVSVCCPATTEPNVPSPRIESGYALCLEGRASKSRGSHIVVDAAIALRCELKLRVRTRLPFTVRTSSYKMSAATKTQRVEFCNPCLSNKSATHRIFDIHDVFNDGSDDRLENSYVARNVMLYG